MSRGTWIGIAVVGVIVIAASIKSNSPPSEQRPPPAAPRVDDKIVRAIAGANMLRRTMRNPDSFALESALAMNGGVVCYVYRSQNGFGGMNREHALLLQSGVIVPESDGRFAAQWDTSCTGKNGADLADAIRPAIY